APGRFHAEFVDPDREPARAEAAQKRFGVSPAEMNEGVVVLTSGARSKFLTRDDLVEPEVDAGGEPAPALRAWKGEAAFVSAVPTVTSDRPTVVCFSKGHGEPDIESFEDGGYATFAEQIRRDGDETRAVERLAPEVPAACRMLVIAEPQQAFGDA